MKKNLQDLTIDTTKLISSLSMSSRASFLEDPDTSELLNQLTPVEYAKLFPKYYLKGSSGGGGGGRAAPSGGGGGGGTVTPTGSGRATPSFPAPKTTTASPAKSSTSKLDQWFQEFKQKYPEAAAKALPQSTSSTTGRLIGGSTIPDKTNKETIDALNSVASRHGLKPEAISMMINLESGWNKTNKTGSYFGLTQMGPSTFREAKNGRLGGLTWDEYKNATSAQQINAYGDWLSHYKFGEKLEKYGINLSSMPANMQAAYLQGMQFAPNADGWKKEFAKGNYNVRTTPTKQARALGSTSIADMASYYDRIQSGSPPQYEKSAQQENPLGTQSQRADVTGTRPASTETPAVPRVSMPSAEELNKLNMERKDFISGKLYMGGREYSYGTGGRNRGSITYGTHEIDTGLRTWSNIPEFVGDSFGVKDAYDPKTKDMRTGILIHSQTHLDQLYSSGCFAISRKEWPDFKKHLLSQIKENGPMVITMNPDGNAYIHPKGTDPTVSVGQFINNLPKQNPSVDPVKADEHRNELNRLFKGNVSSSLLEEFNQLSSFRQEHMLRVLQNNPNEIPNIEKLFKVAPETKPAQQDAAKVVVDAATETTSIVAAGKALQSLGLRVSEHPEFGGVKPVHRGRSHYEGRSFDLNVNTQITEASHKTWGPVFDKIAAWGREKGYKIIWRSSGHYGHMHFEAPRGMENRNQFTSQEMKKLIDTFTEEELVIWEKTMGKNPAIVLKELQDQEIERQKKAADAASAAPAATTAPPPAAAPAAPPPAAAPAAPPPAGATATPAAAPAAPPPAGATATPAQPASEEAPPPAGATATPAQPASEEAPPKYAGGTLRIDPKSKEPPALPNAAFGKTIKTPSWVENMTNNVGGMLDGFVNDLTTKAKQLLPAMNNNTDLGNIHQAYSTADAIGFTPESYQRCITGIQSISLDSIFGTRSYGQGCTTQA